MMLHGAGLKIPLALDGKIDVFFRQKPMSKNAQPIDRKVRSRIYGRGRGWVFTPRFQP